MRKNKVLVALLILAMTFCLIACSCGGVKLEEEKVTVTFDTDGGSEIEKQTIAKGGAVVKPETPKKAGYIFDKWTQNGKEYEFGSAVNEDITLKAIWIDPKESGSSGTSGNKPEEVKVESLAWESNWYWVQEMSFCQPGVQITPESARGQIIFSSSDLNIATVDANGRIYGVKPGYVTITMKCGDKTADLSLEVKSAAKPGISLNTNHLVLHYHNNEVSNDMYALSVSFENGANPYSAVTWISSDPGVAGVSNGVVGAQELGHTVITATTAEGYSASCDVYVTGTALRVYYKGAPLLSGANLDLYYTYELSLVEDHYYENGFSKSVYVSDQCNFSAPIGISFAKQDEYFGIMYFDSSYITNGNDYMIQFQDPLNMVYSDLIWIHIN
ncbi:MAG: InlB B-repeat-containing protein [Lachnospiraceae bacterium]|nr:InlB B-repeat-containing protein [Lachnospiraceae bacterium]